MFSYGPPKKLISNNGKLFAAKFSQDVFCIFDTQNSFTTTYQSQTEREVEGYNGTLCAPIRSFIDEHSKDWDLYTSSETYTYCCTPHSATTLTIYERILSTLPPHLALERQLLRVLKYGRSKVATETMAREIAQRSEHTTQ